ncbi:MAG: YmaF family protein [Eubacteriales bacterium]
MDERHSHNFFGRTNEKAGHLHKIEGVSRCGSPSEHSHTHEIAVTTSFDNGHAHRFNIKTGEAIPYIKGHIHKYNGKTSLNGKEPHRHTVYSRIYKQD